MAGSDDKSDRGRGRMFVTTHWSLVAAAADTSHPDVREALASLCRTYWRPVYVYIRKRGADHERALDLTQGFFATLLEKGYVKDARRERGRFRTFVLTAVKHYVANEWDRETAQKRGGGVQPLSLDAPDAEKLYGLEPADHLTPDKLFERRWARTVLASSLERLGEEMAAAGRAERFRALGPYLTGDETAPYSTLAATLGMSQSAIKVAVHRLRQRFRALVRDEVARTVHESELIEDELRHLAEALST